jgi:hypothetical protein
MSKPELGDGTIGLKQKNRGLGQVQALPGKPNMVVWPTTAGGPQVLDFGCERSDSTNTQKGPLRAC